MKLLLKHIIRSIGKKPLQPIIIILTLSLAMATSIFAFTITDTVESELNVSQTAKYGKAKFAISVGNTSKSRFLFADDVIDAINEDVLVVGCYELPLILEGTGSTAIAMATEFDRVGDLFDIQFLEYGTVTEGMVGDVAFISSDFAEEHQLSIGDTLEVEAMGYSKSYQIQGVSALPFLGTYDVMVDISGLVRAFASNSLLFAAIGEDFKPCSKVYVNADPSGWFKQSSHAIEYLKLNPRFADKNFEDLNLLEKRQVNFSVLEVIIRFAVALAALLSAVVVFCCFYILANERIEENQALSYSGAGPKLLGAMQYAEVMLYWVLGVPLGVLVAIPVTGLIPHFISLQYITVSIKPLAVIKSALILLGVCVLTTAFFIVVNQRMRKKGTSNTTIPPKWIVYLLLVIAALFALMYLLPANPRLTVFIITIAAIVTLIFWSAPLVVLRFASTIEKRMKNVKRDSAIALRYALKNICSLRLLHNIVRLCALIVMIVLTVCLVFASVAGQVKCFANIFNADYMVLNATDSCYQKTKTCQSAKAVWRAYMTQTDWGIVFSADDASVYADWFGMDELPSGNEIIVSLGIADTHNLKTGDTLHLKLNGIKYEFLVSQIISAPTGYLAINCKDMDISYNMLLVEGKDGISSTELLGDLSQTTASELAPIVEADTLLGRLIDAIQIYMDSGKILLLVFVIFSLIGMIDISYESLRVRREEFGLYRLTGMKRGDLRLMKIAELTVSVLFGLVIGLGAFVISAFAVNRGMSSRGMEVFVSILSLLR